MLNKKILGVVAVGLSAIAISAQAATDGVYVGGQLGYGNVHTSGIQQSETNVGKVPSATFTSSNKTTGLAGRVFGGYQFSPNWAAEFGWTKFSTANTKATSSLSVQTIKMNEAISSQIKTDALDLVAKGIFPVSNNVSLYAKLGAAYVIQRTESKGSASASVNGVKITVPASDQPSTTKSTAKKLLPTAGVGVSYAFNDKLSADLGYNRIQKVGNTSVKSTDFVGLGITYSIG
jgi:OOP family OmpA-OmpF porin